MKLVLTASGARQAACIANMEYIRDTAAFNEIMDVIVRATDHGHFTTKQIAMCAMFHEEADVELAVQSLRDLGYKAELTAIHYEHSDDSYGVTVSWR